MLNLKNPHKGITVRDPVELWVDEQTDLPIEFSYGGVDHESEHETRVADFRWNIEVDPMLFEATPPAGFTDITPPTEAKDLESIAGALRLYEKLDGGHYPQSTTVDAATVVQTMKKLAGFEGPEQPAWASDKTYQQIKQAKAGFEWIERHFAQPLPVWLSRRQGQSGGQGPGAVVVDGCGRSLSAVLWRLAHGSCQRGRVVAAGPQCGC